MSPQREWKTEGEIEAIVHREMTDALDKQNDLLERIADGAQASIYSATILHGSVEFGIKGAIPDLQDRMQAMETRSETREKVDDDRHAENSERLEKLERGQGRMRRMFMSCVRFLANKSTPDDEGKSRISSWKLATLACGLGTAWHWIASVCSEMAKKVSVMLHALTR